MSIVFSYENAFVENFVRLFANYEVLCKHRRKKLAVPVARTWTLEDALLVASITPKSCIQKIGKPATKLRRMVVERENYVDNATPEMKRLFDQEERKHSKAGETNDE